MNDDGHDLPWLQDVSGQGPQPQVYDVTGERVGENQVFSDGRRWRDKDWVFWPASSNVVAARYCNDGSLRMQIMYARKRKVYGYYVPAEAHRLYEYGPHPRLTYDLWASFLYSSSKGHWSWAKVDPRWGNPIPYMQIL